MAQLIVKDGRLLVKLSALEKFVAVKGDISVALGQVTSLNVESQPYKALEGARAPGISIKGSLAYGLWKTRHGTTKQFVALHGSHPALSVTLGPESGYKSLLVTVADAQASEHELAQAAGLPASARPSWQPEPPAPTTGTSDQAPDAQVGAPGPLGSGGAGLSGGEAAGEVPALPSEPARRDWSILGTLGFPDAESPPAPVASPPPSTTADDAPGETSPPGPPG